EDGIRDLIVTGVQTCALPISLQVPGMRTSLLSRTMYPMFFCLGAGALALCGWAQSPLEKTARAPGAAQPRMAMPMTHVHLGESRSEERRVGKECSGRGGAE